MESSIAEFLARWPACERLPTWNAADRRAHRDLHGKRQRMGRAATRVLHSDGLPRESILTDTFGRPQGEPEAP